jgi:DNA-directed RNA polymerase specialized sigma subunit
MATRYSKFVMRKKRIERLKNEIGYYQATENATGVDAKHVIVKLKLELHWLETDMQNAYEIINLMKTEQQKYVCELRYMDGKSWEEIKEETGLSLQRLYQINMQIRIHFNDKGREDLLFSEEPGR